MWHRKQLGLSLLVVYRLFRVRWDGKQEKYEYETTEIDGRSEVEGCDADC